MSFGATPNLPAPRRRALAFSLVELLVVVAIIGVLVALLMPSLSTARESGRRVKCLSNQRQIWIYGIAYSSDFNDRLPERGAGAFASNVAYTNADGTALGSTMYNNQGRGLGTLIESYCRIPLYKINNWDNQYFWASWAVPSSLRAKKPNIFHCPASTLTNSITTDASCTTVDYFLAGFGAHQYRFNWDPAYAAYRYVPAAFPRYSAMESFRGYRVAAIVDLGNHGDVGNILGNDGSGMLYRYNDNTYRYTGEYAGFIPMPRSFVATRMGQCLSPNGTWTDGVFTLGLSQIQILDPNATGQSTGWFSAGAINLGKNAASALGY